MEYYSASNNKKILTNAKMNLDDIMLIERSQL